MTKEEIIKIAKGLITDFKCDSDIMVDFCNSIITLLEQEPNEPMVEIDLYSVIKQKYIERDVLDKIRAEIEMNRLEDSSNFCIKAYNDAIDTVMQIIDKYKAESETEE